MGTFITILSFLLAAGAMGSILCQCVWLTIILGWSSLLLRILYKSRFTINIK